MVATSRLTPPFQADQNHSPRSSTCNRIFSSRMVQAAAAIGAGFLIYELARSSPSDAVALGEKGLASISAFTLSLAAAAQVAKNTFVQAPPAVAEVEQMGQNYGGRKLFSSLGCTTAPNAMRAPYPAFNITPGPIDGDLAIVSTGGDNMLTFFGNDTTTFAALTDANNTMPISIQQVLFGFRMPISAVSGTSNINGNVGFVYAKYNQDYFTSLNSTGYPLLNATGLKGTIRTTYPSIAGLANGGWATASKDMYAIYLTRVNSTGGISPITVIYRPGPDTFAPRTAITEFTNGNFLVLYEAISYIQGELLSPTFASLDTNWLSLPGSFPRSIRLPNGNIFIANIYSAALNVNIVDADGTILQSSLATCPVAPIDLDLAISQDGLYVAVLFSAFDGSGTGVFGQLFNAAEGTLFQGDFRINPSISGNQDSVSGAFIDGNRLVTAYRDRGVVQSRTFYFNHPPVVSNPIPTAQAYVGDAQVLDVSNVFSDPDPLTNLSLSTSQLPSWMTYNSTAQTLTIQPRTGDQGVTPVDIRAMDPEGASVTSTVAVNVPNRPPVFSSHAPIVLHAGVGSALFYPAVGASDPDQDTLRFRISGQALSWLIANIADGSLIGVPDASSLGTVINASLVVEDGEGGSDSVPIVGTVAAPPPIIQNIPRIIDVPQGAEIELNFGRDTYFSGSNLEYMFTQTDGSALVSWMRQNLTSLTISASVPSERGLAPISFQFIATNPEGISNSQTCSLVITAPEAFAPFLKNSLPASLGAHEGDSFSYLIPEDTFGGLSSDIPELTIQGSELDLRARFSNANQDGSNPSKDKPTWLKLSTKMSQGKIQHWLRGTPGRIDTNGVNVVLRATNDFGNVEANTVVTVGGASILTVLLSVVGGLSAFGTVVRCAYARLPERHKNKIKQELASCYGTCPQKCKKVWKRSAPQQDVEVDAISTNALSGRVEVEEPA